MIGLVWRKLNKPDPNIDTFLSFRVILRKLMMMLTGYNGDWFSIMDYKNLVKIKLTCVVHNKIVLNIEIKNYYILLFFTPMKIKNVHDR